MPPHRSMNPSPSARRRRCLRLLLCAIGVLVVLLFALLAVVLRENSGAAPSPVAQHHPGGPPWRHGQTDARFVLTFYADLECPFCKDYYPSLKTWIDQQSDISLQWHHLPLAAHEPAASELAGLAECAGETGGHEAFFDAVGWLYQHTRSGGQGLPEGSRYPGLTPALQHCLDSGRPQAIVRSQAEQGAHGGITATPSLRLEDRQSGRSLLLQGPVEGDALLSAMDLLMGDAPDAAPARAAGLSAIDDGDMPR
ncbi:disulfide bond formation protein DsbA [Achromobacter pulmonis]|uniref:Disulfide bond formation protein DsbA n=2 Tax=Achromobacter pulmonis TaxID=1389932 RepID=A0A2N8KBM9_9BURK|nr:disulfide bond formation protein DsbA [Achromobacter pulmonis]